MSQMWTIDARGAEHVGISMMEVIKIYNKMAEKDPDVGVPMSCAHVRLDKKFGPAQVTLNDAGAQQSFHKEVGTDELLSIPGGMTLTVVHDTDPSQSFVIDNPPSGQATFARGTAPAAEEPLPDHVVGDLRTAVLAVRAWLRAGEVGASSQALAEHLVLVTAGLLPRATARDDAPKDIADVRRCWLLLEALPPSHRNVRSMAAVSDDWAQWFAGSPSKWDQAIKRLEDDPTAKTVVRHKARPPFRV